MIGIATLRRLTLLGIYQTRRHLGGRSSRILESIVKNLLLLDLIRWEKYVLVAR